MHLLTHSTITFRKCSILSNNPHCKVREEQFQATNRQRERNRTYSVENEISGGTETHSRRDKCLEWGGGWGWREATEGGREGLMVRLKVQSKIWGWCWGSKLKEKGEGSRSRVRVLREWEAVRVSLMRSRRHRGRLWGTEGEARSPIEDVGLMLGFKIKRERWGLEVEGGG